MPVLVNAKGCIHLAGFSPNSMRSPTNFQFGSFGLFKLHSRGDVVRCRKVLS